MLALSFITPRAHAQQRVKQIGLGVHIYIYTYIYIFPPPQKNKYSNSRSTHIGGSIVTATELSLEEKKMVPLQLSSSDNIHSTCKSSVIKLTGNKPPGSTPGTTPRGNKPHYYDFQTLDTSITRVQLCHTRKCY